MSRDDFWDTLKKHKREKFNADRKKFLEKAIAEDDGEWVKHTDFHWSRFIGEKRLDYWPSRRKYQYDGKVMRGDVMKFIANVKGGAA